ncbi:uncharacterized protein LY79DRAFT_128361 [Colletotrichum navitas]|uniref:Uncharacterized protein n=1 Tax=Colletotrichum navitas TaxID=681940 RepID=A0AAD8Q2R6_9PEZI|nr:uncharacterized protein LY79DRAFT_128361 [Colletotrichum navitas]KAK1594862.1 hypothetical protein LY79DRAFT_128361 [Colletotrichum navitas]
MDNQSPNLPSRADQPASFLYKHKGRPDYILDLERFECFVHHAKVSVCPRLGSRLSETNANQTTSQQAWPADLLLGTYTNGGWFTFGAPTPPPAPQPFHPLCVAALSCHDARLESFPDEGYGMGGSRPRSSCTSAVPASPVFDVELFPSGEQSYRRPWTRKFLTYRCVPRAVHHTARQVLDYGGVRDRQRSTREPKCCRAPPKSHSKLPARRSAADTMSLWS